MRSCSNVVCREDQMTGELFCPLYGGWVEHCPKETHEKEEDYENDDEYDA